MKYKLKQLKISEFDRSRLRGYGNGETLILQRDENSYSVGCSKECTQEFFDQIYADKGPFWKLYTNAGFAIKPDAAIYAVYIGGYLYFIKNTEEKYINNSGAEICYDIRNRMLLSRTNWNVRNVLYILARPMEEMRKFVNLIKFSFYANEMIAAYERLCRNAVEYYGFYSISSNIYDPVRTAKDAFDRAVEMMEYSIAAFICDKYKIRLRYSKYIDNCELENLAMLIETKNVDKIRENFGFYSLNPYDISVSRISDGKYDLAKYRGFNVPEGYPLRWRENVKFIVARYMHIVRICYEKMALDYGMSDAVYHLKIAEMEKINFDNKEEVLNISAVANSRKEKYERQKKNELPGLMVSKNDKIFEIKQDENLKEKRKEIKSLSVSERKTVVGPVVNINSIDDYAAFTEGSIILSKTLSPNLVMLYKKAAGVISEAGGSLSHAAIIAREMKLPCLIQAKIYGNIANGQIIKMNGLTGRIELIEDQRVVESRTTHNEAPKSSDDATSEIPIAARSNNIIINKNPQKDFYFLSSGSLQEKDVGNKAYNLSKIFGKFNVPDGFVVDSEYFRKLTDFKEIDNIIRDIKNTDKSQIDKLDAYYKKLVNEIRGVEFSRKFKIEIEKNYDLLDAKLIAARSSSSCEDQKNVSFAGQFDSYLNIADIESLEMAIKNCWASFYSPRSIIYRKENNINDDKARMAILVQKMINATYSGIAFSSDTMNDNALSIEVIPGTCEKLASGEVSPNIYVLDRESLSVLKVNANYDFDDNLIIDLAKEILRLEAYFNLPQDIEWCIDENSKIWIIQTRPITTVCKIK